MILKASERGGGKQLALHLLNVEDNEHCEIHDLRGFVSENLVSAMKETYAISKGTRCRNFLFSISLNPPQNESVGIDVFEDALRRIEEKTGLTDQPRAVVFHEKEGRRHCHAVYSKIDADEMKAINLSYFKNKLHELSKELYLENDWTMPRGMMDSEARDPRNYTLAEYQQAKRMGMDARDLKATMQECWAVSDSRAAFEHALSERGLVLAKGDRRGHVAVTHEGEVLSVSRYIGKKAKEVREKLGEPDETLPSVAAAKAHMMRDMSQAFNRLTQKAHNKHSQQKMEFKTRRKDMITAHRDERRKIDDGQKQRWEEETRARSKRLNKGLRGLWDRLTGQHARIRQQNVQQAMASLQRDREQRDALVQAQLNERRALQTDIAQTRTRQSALLIQLRHDRKPYRETFEQTAAPEPQPIQSRKPESKITREFGKVAVPRPSQEPPREAVRQIPVTEQPRLVDTFRQQVRTEPAPKLPSSADRLQALRDGKDRNSRIRGPERER